MWLIFWFYIHCKIINQLTLNRPTVVRVFIMDLVCYFLVDHLTSTAFALGNSALQNNVKDPSFLLTLVKTCKNGGGGGGGGGHQHSRQDIFCAHQKSANMEAPKFACVVFTSAHAVSEFGYGVFGYAVYEFNMPYPKSGTAYQILKFSRVARILYETHL